MSNSKPLNLLLFPNIIFDKVISSMYKIDVITIMLCSKKTKKLVETVRMHAWYNDISIRPNETNLSINFGTEMEKSRFEWHVTTEEIDRTNEHLQCREPIGPLVIGDRRFENNFRITAADKMFTVVGEEDRLSTLQHIFEFICKVYRCSGNRLNLTMHSVPNLPEFFEWASSVFDSRNGVGFDAMELKGGTESDRHLAFDKMTNVNCVIVADYSQLGLNHEKLLTMNWLNAYAMPKDLFLARNGAGSMMKNDVEMEPSEMIEYIKKWINGGYDKVRHLRLALPDQLAPNFMKSVLESFPWKKYPTNTRPQHFRENSHLYNLKFGHYLEREDGMRMTMIHTTRDYIRFLVCKGAVPDYTVPRGRQVYQYNAWEVYAVISPLQPKVFETYTAVLLDQQFKV